MTETKAPGLSAAEVAQRIAAGQVNRVRRSDWAEYRDIAARNVLTLFNALVVPAAVALFFLEDYRSAIAVSGMATINLVLGLAQEIRAKWHLDKLALLTESRCRVLRDGQVCEIPAGDVVLGDYLLLAAGDSVVADGTVLEARFLEVDEALLTGESDPVPRKAGEKLLSGSFCVAGEGAYRADKVGAESFAQRTTLEARQYRYTASPIQESINRLIWILTCLAVTLSLSYVVLYILKPFPTTDLVEMIAATITSMVPQGLVLMATLAFILGAVRMSRLGALVQRLNAVESMASIDMLCMDKTGTLTTNRLHLERLCVLAENVTEEAVRDRLRLFASASIDRGSKSLAGLRAALGEAQAELLDQLPFKSQNRCSAVRVRSREEEHVLVLGACEALRPHLQPSTEGWEVIWKQLLGTGLRLLLFADANAADGRKFTGSLDGFVLRPLALVALGDELRPEARRVLELLANQGIGFKILSGDHAETVRATIAPLGAPPAPAALVALAEEPVIAGADLEASADPGEAIRGRSVFGRVSPWQKVQIVTTLKAQGRHVAMIGDGVNDVLVIKNAHLGIAMGDGSRASKTVSGLVLETNDFTLLPETLDEGRTIVRNLRRAGKLFLTKNAYTLILIVGALGVFNLPFPFLPQQVTLLNTLSIGLPAFLITLSRTRSPTPSRLGFVREVGVFALRTGSVISVAGLGMMLLSARVWQDDVPTQRTLLLSTLVLLGLSTLLRVRTHGETRTPGGDRGLLWLAAGAVPVYLTAIYWPFAADFFVLTPLTLAQWGWVLALVVPAHGLVRLTDRPGARRAGRIGDRVFVSSGR
jgi:cation-transporting ATPase E